MRTHKFAVVISLMFAAAGCVESPTTGVPPTFEPAFDGGWTAGSGNRTAPADSGAVTVSDAGTCDERGGWTAGSGNREGDPPSCSGAEGL